MSRRCGTCKMRDADGQCWGYGNLPVDAGWLCDSWAESEQRQLSTAEPTARWFEALLSQDRLREAFDGCRDHIQAACTPAVLTVARQMAHQAANGALTPTQPPSELVDALHQHYSDLYQLGRDTVRDELARQRQTLGTQRLSTVTDSVGATMAGRLVRARRRAEHSARTIVGKIAERLGRDQITGLKTGEALQAGAETAAQSALRMEALANTTASVNDGRNDEATRTTDVIGAYYTSVLDERTCENCARSDDGTLLSPEDAVMLGPPNPLCDGQDRCRCTLVWTLSSDPSAVLAVS